MDSTSETPPPAEQNSEELSRLVARFVAGDIDAAGRQRLAELVRADPVAARAYRDQLERAASIGRLTRSRREEAAILRDGARTERGREVAAQRRRGIVSDKASRARARTLVLPAAFLLSVFFMTRGREEPPALSLAWHAGEVLATGEALGTQCPGAELRRGDWAVAHADGSAALSGGDTEVRLDADTWLLVEEVEPPRLRLEAGALEVRGPCTVTTRAGIAEVEEGSARVALEGAALSVSCRRGRVVVVDAGGERVLGAGDRAGAGPGDG